MLGQGSPTNVSLLVFWGRAQGQPAVAIWACGKLRDRIPRGPGQVPPLRVDIGNFHPGRGGAWSL